MEMETTLDKLLGGRFEVLQPKEGYRIAVDTLLLAGAVPAQDGQSLLDLGCGVGGVMLAVACRVEGVRAVGLEIEEALVRLCEANIRRSGREGGLSVRQGDVAALPDVWGGAFDHVAMNPPYHDPKSHAVSDHPLKRRANTEDAQTNLSLWIERAAWALKERGVLTLIHRADRRGEIESLLAPFFGATRVRLIRSKESGPARRVLFRAQKKGAYRLFEEAPFVLHDQDGNYSKTADAVLRDAEAIE